MSPRLLLALAVVATCAAASAAAWALTRPAAEREVAPIRIESPAQPPAAGRGDDPAPAKAPDR